MSNVQDAIKRFRAQSHPTLAPPDLAPLGGYGGALCPLRSAAADLGR
ncbi:MAG TPA: hypothetical protein ACFYD7_01895 [Candidatus Wujingus californicus]|nr:hypothetical protein [Planctomycetota bacterium]